MSCRPLRFEPLEARRLLATTQPVAPAGSLVFTHAASDAIAIAGEVDSLTVDLDAGQTLSVVVDPTSALVAEVEISDPTAAIVASGLSSAPGAGILAQSIPVTVAGTYTITIRGASSTTGTYDVTLTLNAAVEAESVDVLESNDDPAAAQDMESSFLAVGSGAGERGAVTGVGDGGPDYAESLTKTNVVHAPNVLTYEFTAAPAPQGDATLTITATADLDTSSEYLVLNAEGLFTKNVFVTDGLQQVQVTTQVVIPQATLAQLAADGIVTITVTPTTSVNNLGANELTLDLAYPGGGGASDWFRFRLQDGQSSTLVLAGSQLPPGALELYEGDGVTRLATSAGPANQHTISGFVDLTTDGLPNDYYARVAGVAGAYNLVVTREADFDAVGNDSLVAAQDLTASGAALGSVSGIDEDYYRVSVQAGDVLQITTSTPGDGPLEFDNLLDPGIELFDPTGAAIPYANGTGNESLSHLAALTGDYVLRVFSENTALQGAYVLEVDGYTGAQAPLEVVGTNPADGARISGAAPLTQFVVNFSGAVHPGSVDASDLLVDGLPALGVTQIASDSLAFDLPTLADGVHSVTLAADALKSLQGAQLAPYAGQFILDNAGPRVVASSIQDGDVLAAGSPLTYMVQFDEPLSVAALGFDDVILMGVSGSRVAPISMNYDAVASTLTFAFPALAEDLYTLTLISGNGAFEDTFGNDLDGELPAGPIGPNVSGDGVSGGDFILHFGVDDSSIKPFPVPFTAIEPLGSLAYRGSVSDAIKFAGDADAYIITLDANQTVSVLVQGSGGLTPRVTLTTPAGDVETVTAAGPDGTAVLQTVPATLAGDYIIEVDGAGGPSGGYGVEVVLNAAAEGEAYGGPGNDELTSAQDLDGSFLGLGIGGAERAAVVGTGADGTGDIYRFTLSPNQSATLALSSLTAGGGTLELRDAAGALLAVGDRAGNVDQIIRNFISSSGGVYYAVVLGTSGDYGVVVTRNADFDAEPNNGLAPVAQDITLTGTALGGVLQGGDFPTGAGTPRTGPFNVNGTPLSLGFAVDGSFVGSSIGAVFNGAEYLRAGTFLATYAASINGVSRSNGSPSNSTAFPVQIEDLSSGSRHVIRATGTIVTGVVLQRVVSWADGDDYALIATKIVNNTSSALINVAVLENLDPDPGGIYETNNDVSANGRFVAASNSAGAMALGSDDPRATASAEGFYITDPFVVINSPEDPNGAPKDVAVNLAFNLGTIAAGASESCIAVMAFGATQAAVEATYADVAHLTVASDLDAYSVVAVAGDILTITASVPAAGAGEFVNDLDLAIEMYDPLGNLVASDATGSLTYATAMSGAYTVFVVPENDSRGEYVVNVSGHTGALAPFSVAASDPMDGAHLLTAPSVLRISLSDVVLATSVEASDLTVDGVPATAVTIVNGTTLEFTLPAAVEGANHVAIAGGALVDLQVQPLEPFSATYDLDFTPPRVIASSLLEGDAASSSTLVYTAQFDDPLEASGIDASDVVLTGQAGGARTPDSFHYDAATSTLTVEYVGLTEDRYTLTLLSGVGRFADPFGRALDGEADGATTVPSGDGLAGGDFVVHFTYDNAAILPFPIPLSPLDPRGSSAYRGTTHDVVQFAGDQDLFSLPLEKNQAVSVIVRGSGGLTPQVRLETPGLPLTAAAVAPEPNGAAVLDGIPTNVTGDYKLRIEGADGTSGNYTITVLLNAVPELENYDGSDNELQEDAQDLDLAFQTRGTLGSSIATVVGQGDVGSGPIYADTLTKTGVVSTGNVLTYDFTSAPPPLSDAVLTATAFADLDLSTEYLRLEAEGVFLGNLFVSGGSQTVQVTTQVTIPQATLASLAADGVVSFTVTPSAEVGSSTSSFLTLRLEYASGAPMGGDWYRFTLDDGESASLALDAAHVTVLELVDAAGNPVATGVQAFDLAQLIANFVDPTSDGLPDAYFVHVTSGAGPYNLVVARNSDFDAETNQDFANAQDIGGTLGVSGHLVAGPPAASGDAEATSSAHVFASAAIDGPIPILQTFAGPGYSNGVPPDPTLAAGPEQVVAIVNTSIAIYDKSTGAQLFSQSLNGSSGFFGSTGATTTIFDPWIVYDADADRFLAIAIDTPSSSTSFLYVATSTDSTPTSGADWHKYRIPFTHTPAAALGSGIHFADYPKFGVSADAVWISGNYFPLSAGSGIYAGITAIEKSALLAGGAVNILYQEFFSGFSVMPMTQYDSGSTQYFAESSTDSGSSIRIHAIADVLTAPVRTTATVAVAPFQAPGDIPQLGGSTAVDSIDARVMTGVWRDGSMWFAHAILDPAVDTESVVRWYEVGTNGFGDGGTAPTLVQSGNVDPGPGLHTWIPAISVDSRGTMAIGFGLGGPSMYLGAGFTGRLAGDPAGATVLPVTQYAVGQGSYRIIDGSGRNRWGDYSGLAVDPNDDGTFWVFNEYPTASGVWATQIASFQLQQVVDDDWYQFGVIAGDILRLQTFTPGGGAGEPQNLLDPSIELYDPAGNLVARSDNAGNETLFHIATSSGQYRVRVFSETTDGEYFLQVEGATGDSLPPVVIDADPDVGAKVNAFPTTYTLALSEAAALASLQAADLVIGGLPAIALTVVDARTLEFTIDPAANLGSGVYSVALAAGAIQDLQGVGNPEFTSTFEVDVTPPVILNTFWNGSPLKISRLYNEGPLTFQALFSEDLFLAGSSRKGLFTPGTDDVFATNKQTGAVITPQSVEYDPATDLLTAQFTMLPEGEYTLSILSGNGSVEDTVGNDLDGEPLGGDLDGTTTGDGTAGGDYSVDFAVDRTSPAPLQPFTAAEPLGSLIAVSRGNTGFINTSGDQEVFEFVFEASQSLSAVVRPDDPLAVLTVQLVGVTPIYAAAAPGQPVVLPLTALAATGLYELRVSGDAKSHFTLDAVVNAAVESGSDTDDGRELAIDNSLLPLGAVRYAVIGDSAASPGGAPLAADVDEYTLDLSGQAGRRLDVILAGQNGVDFSGQLLELLDDAGAVLATASANPLGAGTNADNFDLGIAGFTIPDIGSNIATLRVRSTVAGQYALLATVDLLFEVEPNSGAPGPLRDLDQSPAALGYLLKETVVADGQIEPDDYAVGTVLNTVVPGVVLSINGSLSSSVLASTSTYAPTGTRAFTANGTLWSSGTLLYANFAEPTDLVSITAGSDDSSDVSFLSAYNASGVLLATVTSRALSTGQSQVLTISRAEGDIASVRAGGVGGDAVILDRLQFHIDSAANAGDAYQFSLLAGQSATFFTETPSDGAFSLPGNTLDPRLTILDAADQVLTEDANSRDGKNAELTFTATVAGVYRVRVGQESGEGAYLLRAVKGPVPADFDENGLADGSDFLAWQRSAGLAPPLAAKTDGDANGDQAVDADDLALWQAQYGLSGPSAATTTASATAVAESTPATLAVAEPQSPPSALQDAVDAALAMLAAPSPVSAASDAFVASSVGAAQADGVESLPVDDLIAASGSPESATDDALSFHEPNEELSDALNDWLADEALEMVLSI